MIISSLKCLNVRLPHITEGKNAIFASQNHRMVGVGRDLCGSSSPTTVPKQGLLEQAA